jgi:hypothetical protein
MATLLKVLNNLADIKSAGGVALRVRTQGAQLPEMYNRAKEALAICERVDELDDCADKMAALAAYARQADDLELEDYARRIRARAVRRLGELLREYDGRGRRKTETPLKISIPSRAEAAEAAGISPHKVNVAARIASIPREQFEEAVEVSPAPGTISLSKFAEGNRSRSAPDLTTADFRRASAKTLIAALRDIQWRSREYNRTAFAEVLKAKPDDLASVLQAVCFIEKLRGDLQQAGLCKSYI